MVKSATYVPSDVVFQNTADTAVGGEKPYDFARSRGKILGLGPRSYMISSNGTDLVWVPQPSSMTSFALISNDFTLSSTGTNISPNYDLTLPTVITANSYKHASCTINNKGLITTITSINSNLISNISSDYSISVLDQNKTFVNTNVTTALAITLPNAVLGYRYSFSIASSYYMIIKANTYDKIQSGNTSSAIHGFIMSSTTGSNITLTCLATNTWVVESLTGVWDYDLSTYDSNLTYDSGLTYTN